MRLLLIILSLLGFLDSSFLVWDSLSAAENCKVLLASLGLASCSTVTESSYGVLLGYPISIFGMVAYSSIGILTLLGFKNGNYRKGIFSIALVGFVASLYLTYVQWQVLASWCFFCLISALLMTFILLTALAYLGNVFKYGKRPRHDIQKSIKVLLWVMAVILVGFEVLRGRLYYHTQPTQATVAPTVIQTILAQLNLRQDDFIGELAGELITLGEINALSGSLQPQRQQAAFDYFLLKYEAQQTKKTLATLITEQTTLHLYAPAALSENSENSENGENNVQAPKLLPIDETASLAVAPPAIETSTDSAAAEKSTPNNNNNTPYNPTQEDEFAAYLAFLDRAAAKEQLATWENYLYTLKRTHQANFVLP